MDTSWCKRCAPTSVRKILLYATVAHVIFSLLVLRFIWGYRTQNRINIYKFVHFNRTKTIGHDSSLDIDSNTAVMKYRVPDYSNPGTGTRNMYQKLDIYLRMTTAVPVFPEFYEHVLKRSLSYFWPGVSLVVVLDDENADDHKFASKIQDAFPFPRMCYMKAPETVDISQIRGKDRMQRDMFYPELCTSKKYVGFVDTDTMFVTRVVPDILFQDDKPIVIGVYGNIAGSNWDGYAKSTEQLFKTKEVLRCMTYFPVIVKTEHMALMRKYIERLHNAPFDKILFENITLRFSQFHFMCQYLWMFHREEYTFYFQSIPGPPDFSKSRQDPEYYEQILPPEQIHPFPRSSIHYKYYEIATDGWRRPETYRRLLKSGTCFSGGFVICPEKCNSFDNSSLQKELFLFEYLDWTWDNRCFAAQIAHYKKMLNYTSVDFPEVIQMACDEIDHLTWIPPVDLSVENGSVRASSIEHLRLLKHSLFVTILFAFNEIHYF